MLNILVPLEESHFEKYNIVDAVMKNLAGKKANQLGKKEIYQLVGTFMRPE